MNGMGPVFVIVAVGVVIFVVCVTATAIEASSRRGLRWRIRTGAGLVDVLADSPALEGSRR